MNNLYKNYMMKMGGQWIKSAIKKPGAFTKQAKAAGMSVSDFAQSVLSNKEDYSGTTVKRANLAKTLSKMKKAQGGMEFKNPMGADSSLMEMESAPMAASPAMGMQSSSPLMGSDFEVEPSIQALDPNLDFARKDVASLEKQAEKDNVRSYQRMLNQKYGAGLAEDGAWGPKTQAAYEKFITSKKETGQDQYERMVAAKKAEAMFGSKEKPVRMDEIQIKAKSRKEPITVLPKRPIPQIQPKLPSPMDQPAARFNSRSFSDNARVAPMAQPIRNAMPASKRKPTTISAANDGYRSRLYTEFLKNTNSK
jgi:hypothetical protein